MWIIYDVILKGAAVHYVVSVMRTLIYVMIKGFTFMRQR